MSGQLDQLGLALEITLAVFILVLSVVIIYTVWLLIRLHWYACRGLRPPQVPRDAHGRRIKERV